MKKVLLIAALTGASTLFASGHGTGDAKCDLKYNHCMAECSVKYGSDRTCVESCNQNYADCKAGLETEDYAPQKAPATPASKEAPEAEHGEHH